MAHFIESGSHLDSLDLLLVSNFVEFALCCHVHFLLVFRLLQTKLLPNSIGVALRAEILKFIFGPNFFLNSLGPCLILVVVTYHAFFAFFKLIFLTKLLF